MMRAFARLLGITGLIALAICAWFALGIMLGGF